jgi:hypothetical protein
VWIVHVEVHKFRFTAEKKCEHLKNRVVRKLNRGIGGEALSKKERGNLRGEGRWKIIIYGM